MVTHTWIPGSTAPPPKVPPRLGDLPWSQGRVAARLPTGATAAAQSPGARGEPKSVPPLPRLQRELILASAVAPRPEFNDTACSERLRSLMDRPCERPTPIVRRAAAAAAAAAASPSPSRSFGAADSTSSSPSPHGGTWNGSLATTTSSPVGGGRPPRAMPAALTPEPRPAAMQGSVSGGSPGGGGGGLHSLYLSTKGRAAVGLAPSPAFVELARLEELATARIELTTPAVRAHYHYGGPVAALRSSGAAHRLHHLPGLSNAAAAAAPTSPTAAPAAAPPSSGITSTPTTKAAAARSTPPGATTGSATPPGAAQPAAAPPPPQFAAARPLRAGVSPTTTTNGARGGFSGLWPTAHMPVSDGGTVQPDTVRPADAIFFRCACRRPAGDVALCAHSTLHLRIRRLTAALQQVVDDEAAAWAAMCRQARDAAHRQLQAEAGRRASAAAAAPAAPVSFTHHPSFHYSASHHGAHRRGSTTSGPPQRADSSANLHSRSSDRPNPARSTQSTPPQQAPGPLGSEDPEAPRSAAGSAATPQRNELSPTSAAVRLAANATSHHPSLRATPGAHSSGSSTRGRPVAPARDGVDLFDDSEDVGGGVGMSGSWAAAGPTGTESPKASSATPGWVVL